MFKDTIKATSQREKGPHPIIFRETRTLKVTNKRERNKSSFMITLISEKQEP